MNLQEEQMNMVDALVDLYIRQIKDNIKTNFTEDNKKELGALGARGIEGSVALVEYIENNVAIIMNTCDSESRSRKINDLLSLLFKLGDTLHKKSKLLREENTRAAHDYINEVTRFYRKLLDIIDGNNDATLSEFRQRATRGLILSKRQEGAILSDYYRNESDISHHINALTAEIEGLQHAISITKGNWEQIAISDNADVVAGCFSSVGLSCYRLKRYDIGLDFLGIAESMRLCGGNKISEVFRKFIQNNYASVCYGFVKDMDMKSGGMTYPNWVDSDSDMGLICLTKEGRNLRLKTLDEALSAYRRACEEEVKRDGKSRNWNNKGNLASVLLYRGDVDSALKEIKELEQLIRDSGQESSAHMARCYMITSRIYFERAQRSEENPKERVGTHRSPYIRT